MLIAITILSPILLLTVICFVLLWSRAHRARIRGPLYENAICHIGISIGIAHPRHIEQITAALDSRYPLCEVVVVVDVEQSPIEELIQRFHLVRVNFEQLLQGTDVRGLYRSHRRQHQQVVVIDLPQKSRTTPYEAIHRVASYIYIMMLSQNAIPYSDSATYIANTIASYPLDNTISIRSIVGAKVWVQHIHPSQHERLVLVSRPLAYQYSRLSPLLVALLALIAPTLPVAASIATQQNALLIIAAIIVLMELAGIYISCRIVTKRGLLSTFGTIIMNFYRFLVDDMRNFRYLYKKCEGVAATNSFCAPIANKREKHYHYDRTDKRVSTTTRIQRRTAGRRRDYDHLRE